MNEFAELWKAAVRFRKASRELEWLLRAAYDAMPADDAKLRASLEQLLVFLASDAGRTDANCTTTYNFMTATEDRWRTASEALRAILDDMSGTLHESIYAPDIARTFESTPEQLLARLRAL
ncbi:MAG TPA: hypothetical protein VHW00_02235 [Thermoanaerobaculia bacterium]|nr:hypothetical protein [Thermoanaerobaculia bacterium]